MATVASRPPVHAHAAALPRLVLLGQRRGEASALAMAHAPNTQRPERGVTADPRCVAGSQGGQGASAAPAGAGRGVRVLRSLARRGDQPRFGVAARAGRGVGSLVGCGDIARSRRCEARLDERPCRAFADVSCEPQRVGVTDDDQRGGQGVTFGAPVPARPRCGPSRLLGKERTTRAVVFLEPVTVRQPVLGGEPVHDLLACTWAHSPA